MTEPNRCPRCNAECAPDSPLGLCAQCLLKEGMECEGGEASSRSADGAPEPAELSQHFPQLEILELVGEGGMGAVYKARQRDLDRLVALKILTPKFGRDPSFAERFMREGRAMAKLNHPHIVIVYEFGQANGLYFLIMEYVDGVNLRESLQAGRLSPDEALAIVPQICEALQFAHDEGVVHRDIKPENVLLDKRGRVKIADFGLAKLLGRTSAEMRLTISQQMMGTMNYMAPEQMKNPLAVDHRADIYSLGVVFYELLTGELPIGKFEPPSNKVRVDVRLDEVVLRSLESDPDRRYQHASEVKTEVEKMSEYQSAAAFAVARPAPKVAGISLGSEPHYGLLILGVVMIGLGLPLLATALLTPAHDVFAWIGMGVALNGGGCCSLAFLENCRLPGGARPTYGMLIQSGIMGLIGVLLMLSSLYVGDGFESIHPSNAFIWIGMGLLLGGGGICFAAWEAERPRGNDRLKKPPVRK